MCFHLGCKYQNDSGKGSYGQGKKPTDGICKLEQYEDEYERYCEKNETCDEQYCYECA